MFQKTNFNNSFFFNTKSAIGKSVCSQSEVFIIVFSLDDYDSFKNISKYTNFISTNCDMPLFQIPLLLVGNKSDLPNHKVSQQEIEKVAQELRTQCIITSCKPVLKNINEMFEQASLLALQKKVHEHLRKTIPIRKAVKHGKNCIIQ